MFFFNRTIVRPQDKTIEPITVTKSIPTITLQLARRGMRTRSGSCLLCSLLSLKL